MARADRGPKRPPVSVALHKKSAPVAKRSTTYPGRLRIIGGKWRGRRLDVPEEAGLRPTPDRVRETLFNWLQAYLPGANCLDLFAGTGALCLEALSRGAGHVVMVEKATHVVDQLRRHVQLLQAENATVWLADALEFLQQTPQAFDIIFLDPPFQSELIARGAELIEAHGWIKPGGLIYIEAPSHLKDLPIPPSWELIRSKKAGQVGYHLARKREG